MKAGDVEGPQEQGTRAMGVDGQSACVSSSLVNWALRSGFAGKACWVTASPEIWEVPARAMWSGRSVHLRW